MSLYRFAALAAFLLGSAFIGAPAIAQKSEDTLRIAVSEPFKSMLPYEYTQTEASPFYFRVYENLVQFDDQTRKFVPDLATTWKRVSDTVLEFDLREGVKFHNGNAFDADDIVHTVQWTSDPNVKILFKERYSWVKSVEKLGPYKVRLTTDGIYATDLMSLAFRLQILDAETHKAAPDDYGRKNPIGTGPYKVSLVDSNRGAIVERFDGYKPTEAGRRAPIRRIHAVPIPDAQTQVAKLMVGEIDVIREVSPDNADALAKNPTLEITPIDSQTLLYFQLDAAGRSGRTEFKDPRVRKALFMAIDREAIINNIIPGGKVATRANAVCFKTSLGCEHSVEPIKFDPAAAKKLLAEAGYPNGLDLKLMGHVSMRAVSEAISGDLYKIGVRSTVESQTIGVMRTKRGDGLMETYVAYYPNSVPDVSEAAALFFDGDRDYTGDKVILDAMAAGNTTHDQTKRNAAYKTIFDRVNSEFLMLPISSRPFNFAHAKTVRVDTSPLSPTLVSIGDFFWK